MVAEIWASVISSFVDQLVALMTNYNKFGSNYCHWWLDCGSLGVITTKINDIEAVMVAVVPSWLSENLHHFIGFIHDVHIGSENVGT